jgi:sodium pump decarboxylase gamma subunit
MNFLLEITKDNYDEPIRELFGAGETFLFGIKIFAIGMGAVFTALFLIYLTLQLFSVISGNKTKTESAPVVTQKVEETVKEEIINTNDGEIVAVIAAAIAMAEEETPGAKFKVVSFRRS